ncbi:hypothetical protein [Asticcacaulis sp.]|uniref:hypothetical protein n=1 Tax=Asticcacaulis sp. TaxID=1872648 RepID=UPI00260263F3|nr:hypothetical protein [Asticcacaulis sp.]
MSPNERKELQDEYSLLFNVFEKYGNATISIKAMGTTLVTAGLLFSFKENNLWMVGFVIILTFSLWYLEASWKAWQATYDNLLMEIERAMRDKTNIAAFQARTEWCKRWHTNRRKTIWVELWKLYVLFPYILVIAAGLIYLGHYAYIKYI